MPYSVSWVTTHSSPARTTETSVEPSTPEDMSHEHVYHHGQYLWDMHVLQLMREGRTRELVDELPDFIDQTESETKAGSLTWLLSALGYPDYPAEVQGYGTVIGTGNAVVEWDPERARGDARPGAERATASRSAVQAGTSMRRGARP